jgi:hypothetical protein
MGTRGRKRVEEHFTIEQTAKKVEAVYRRVLRKNGSNRDTSA